MSISRARQSSRPSTAAAKVCIRPDFEAAMATPTSKFTGQIAPLCDHGSPPLRTCSSVSGFRNDSKTETGRRRWRSLQAQILADGEARAPARLASRRGRTAFQSLRRFFIPPFSVGRAFARLGYETISLGRSPPMTPNAVQQPSVKLQFSKLD